MPEDFLIVRVFHKVMYDRGGIHLLGFCHLFALSIDTCRTLVRINVEHGGSMGVKTT